MKLIDKDALVAEIERRLKKYAALDVGNSEELEAIYGAECKALIDILKFLDTLEVKEVDLELNSFDAIVCKIGSTYLKEMDRDAIVKVLESFKDRDKVKVIIKAQKGENYESTN